MYSSLSRIFKLAFQNFFRNIWLSVINITIITLTLLTVNFLIIFNLLADNAIDLVKDKVDVSVYFKQSVTEDQISEFKDKILSSEYIKSVEYVSSETALSKFENKYSSNEDIIDAVDELKQDGGDVFLPSLKIKAKDISLYDDILTELKESQYSNLFDVDESQFQDYATVTNRIDSVSSKIKIAGYIVSILFMIMTLMMVYNSIKIGVYTYREEISIMKLVGATSNFIKSPFMLEILLYNIISIFIVILLVYISLSILNPIVVRLFEGYPTNLLTYFNSNFIIIFFSEFVISSLFSGFSSLIAMKKYLK
ncbi:MAG: permease-like cell division protein FtsX [Patescibacteria group bacterium]|nr:permease-like cell division protein FtsX [Patescibacteria group bacterium]MDD4304429.1 permease-like cell division protein FtsX [Patescibacteria group bacterium]MDD4695452.1 permease-like cell division protein FtsX [Patescibacteria group bacterium]